MSSLGSSSFSPALRCPDDGHLLRRVADALAPFAVCSHCAGLWFMRDAIERPATDPAAIPAPSRRPAAWPRPRAGQRPCPACPTAPALEARRVEGIEIDRCPRCGGVWLDPGEYDAVRVRLQAQVPPAPPTEGRRRLTGGATTGDLMAEGALELVLHWLYRLVVHV